MLKTISAALFAVSVLTVPAMAAGPGRTAHAPFFKTVHVKQGVLHSNARMGRHHRHHHLGRHHHYRYFPHHYRFHRHR